MPNGRDHANKHDPHAVLIFVQEAVQDFLASPDVKHLATTTQAEYTHVLSTFATWCNTYSLKQTSHSHWEAICADSEHISILLKQVNEHVVALFLEHVKAHHVPSKKTVVQLSSHTIANYTKCIKRFLNWCLLDEEYAEQVQVAALGRIKKPKLEETILDIFSDEQLEALKRACAKEESDHLRLRDEAILAVLLDTGIREKELITLTIGHVHLDAKDAYIRVFGKGNKWGEVGLGEQSRRLVQHYIRQYREPVIAEQLAQDKQFKKLPPRSQQLRKREAIQQACVFVNRSHKPLTKSGLYQLITRLGEWAGIIGVRCSPHTFRHTFAVNYIRQGGDIYTLSKLLRHSSVKVTEEYLKALQQTEARHRAHSVLDNL